MPGSPLLRLRAWPNLHALLDDSATRALDCRLVILWTLNVILLARRYRLRIAYDEGDPHPLILGVLMAATLSTWRLLAITLAYRLRAIAHASLKT